MTNFETTIETLVRELLEKMGFQPKVSVRREDDAYNCRAELLEDQNFLIGQHGVNLAAIQHLVRILARRKTGEKLNVTVDVNDYFSGKKALLEKEAERALEEVVTLNASVALRPMPPYERKVIHSYLAKREEVVTESVGLGEERKILVRPRHLL
jgi:spoIIIJ-associated protein